MAHLTARAWPDANVSHSNTHLDSQMNADQLTHLQYNNYTKVWKLRFHERSCSKSKK